MKYETLQEFHSKLAKTSNYSEHNKEVLNDYFSWASNHCNDVSDGALSKYASRWYTLSELIDFKLDEATRDDTMSLVAAINNDELTKSSGESYSAPSKKKFVNIVTSFYNKFIDRNGRGYSEDIDGPLLVARLSYEEKPDNEVKTETKPNAADMKKIAKQPDNFRDRCIITFMFATGARIGEVFPTGDKPNYLVWDDITFSNDDSMRVKLRKNNKKENGNRRSVNVVISKPMMRKWKEKQQPNSLEEPVFPKLDMRMYCPECSSKATQENEATFERRKYSCQNCDWEGKTRECQRKKEPLSASQVRRNIVKPAVQAADVTPKAQTKEMDDTPHKLFRKSRALQKQAQNWGDSPLRDFFGWSESSRSPKRYKQALQVNQKQELAKTFDHLETSIDGYFLSDALDPALCSCGELNSRLWDLCKSCGDPISYQGVFIKETDPDSEINKLKHDAKDEVIIEQAEDPEKAKQKLKDAVRNQLEEKEVI